jgi:hypothetical protein
MRISVAGIAAALVGIWALTRPLVYAQTAGGPPNTGMADPVALINAFDGFRATSPAVYEIPLSGFRGLSESFNAGGSVSIDLSAGTVTSQVRGLPVSETFSLWLVDNRPSETQTTFVDASLDVTRKIGDYSVLAGRHSLSVLLSSQYFAEFLPDRAFVVRGDGDPATSFALAGSATLFDRLLRRQVRFTESSAAPQGFDPTAPATRTADFARLVADGRRIFLKETFAGNGRTCGTCHVENNNFTIEPAFIATLPRTDPLFVAENNPALAVNFEKPDLMRRFGLILENVDGFDDLANKFTMRGTQTVLALASSMVRPAVGLDSTRNGRNADPPERLGWGNDGLPLRDFAIGAIVQHATKTLHRRSGVDFRLPTDEELDALAAYQLALGHQEDFNLPVLELRSSLATKGKLLFLDTGGFFEPGRKNCTACHFNAGATAGAPFDPSNRGFNIAAPTNANETPVALSLALPRDGGFGLIPLPTGGFGNFADIPGFPTLIAEEFNTPGLVSAADTAPLFHNHTLPDLESAVAFYGTPAFQTGLSIGSLAMPVSISSDPNDPEVQAISGFLRVLNVLENIRSSINIIERGRQMTMDADVRELAGLALAETVDAIEVLSEGALARSVEPDILTSRAHLIAARATLDISRQLSSRAAMLPLLEQSVRSLRTARSALANPETLPATYRN